MDKHFSIIVRGKVQGVFFRASAADKAKLLNLRGLVKNEVDGSVSLEVEGEELTLQTFLEWLKIGPPRAKVERIELLEGDIVGYKEFKIQR